MRPTYMNTALFLMALCLLAGSGCKTSRGYTHDVVMDNKTAGTKYTSLERKKIKRSLFSNYSFAKATEDIAVRCRRKKDGYHFKLMLKPKLCMWAKYIIECEGRLSGFKNYGQTAKFIFNPAEKTGTVPPGGDTIRVTVKLPPQKKGHTGYLINLEIFVRFESWDDVVIEDAVSRHEVVK